MNVLDFARVGDSYLVAVVDDPKDGVAKLAVVPTDGGEAVVLDFDALVTIEALQVAGPREAQRVAKAIREQLLDSGGDDEVS